MLLACALGILGIQAQLPHGQAWLLQVFVDLPWLLLASGGLAAAVFMVVLRPAAAASRPREASGTSGRWLLASLAVLALAALVAPPIAWRALVAGVSALIVLACGGFGCQVLRWTLGDALLRRLTAAEMLAVSCGLGLGALALGTFLAGSLGLLSPWVLGAWMIVLTVIGRKQALALASRAAGAIDAIGRERSALVAAAPLLIAALTLLRLLSAFDPPADYDVLEYHLALPAEYLRLGRVAVLPHNVFSGFPQNAEMLSLWSLGLFEDRFTALGVAKTLNVWVGLVAAAGVWGLASRLAAGSAARRWAGALAALVFCGMVWSTVLAFKLYVELLQSLYAVAALTCLIAGTPPKRGEPHQSQYTGRISPASDAPGGKLDSGGTPPAADAPGGEPDSGSTPLRWAVLTGLLAGLGGGVKYPALLFVAVPVGGLLLVRSWRAAGVRRGLIETALYAAVTMATVSPYLIRNSLATGNPTFPLLYEVFGGRHWTDLDDARFRWSVRPRQQIGASVGNIFFRRNLPGAGWTIGLRTSPLLAIFLPMGLLGLFVGAGRLADEVPRAKRDSRGAQGLAPRAASFAPLAVAGIFAFHLLCWMLLTHRIERFLYPAYGILAAALAAGLVGWRSARLRQAASAVCIGVTLLSGPFLVRMGLGESPASLLGVYAPRTILRRRLGPTYAGMEAVNALPEGSRVLLLGEARTSYLTMPHVYATVYDSHPLLEALHGRPGAAREALQALGVTHVYVNWSEVQRLETTYAFPHQGREFGGLRLTGKAWKYLAELLRENATVLWQAGARLGPDLAADPAENLRWARRWNRHGATLASGSTPLFQIYKLNFATMRP